MESEVYPILERSSTEELFLLRILTREALLSGLPVDIPSEILSVGEGANSSLFYFIRLLLGYSHKPSTITSRDNIIQRLANLPINDSIINEAFNTFANIGVSHPQIKRELLFTLLAREINPQIDILPSLKRYVNYIIQHEI